MASAPAAFSLRHKRVRGRRFIGEVQARNSGGADQGAGFLQRFADEADPDRADLADRGRREQAAAVGAEDIRREILEARAGERLEAARDARRVLARSRRSASAAARPMPLSNSWLPTEARLSPSRFIASIVGSSRKYAEASGDAPIRSPAATVMLFGWPAARVRAPRRAAPPRRRAPSGSCRRACVIATGSGGVSILPWKSLIARICTSIGACASRARGGATRSRAAGKAERGNAQQRSGGSLRRATGCGSAKIALR